MYHLPYLILLIAMIRDYTLHTLYLASAVIVYLLSISLKETTFTLAIFSFYNKPNGNIWLDNKTFENIGHQIFKRNT